uniref:Uncharacterized protein n=1 Tax=Arundo donax TaxID=35708 RepID=A0A0A8YBT7_ARUDO
MHRHRALPRRWRSLRAGEAADGQGGGGGQGEGAPPVGGAERAARVLLRDLPRPRRGQRPQAPGGVRARGGPGRPASRADPRGRGPGR